MSCCGALILSSTTIKEGWLKLLVYFFDNSAKFSVVYFFTGSKINLLAPHHFFCLMGLAG